MLSHTQKWGRFAEKVVTAVRNSGLWHSTRLGTHCEYDIPQMDFWWVIEKKWDKQEMKWEKVNEKKRKSTNRRDEKKNCANIYWNKQCCVLCLLYRLERIFGAGKFVAILQLINGWNAVMMMTWICKNFITRWTTHYSTINQCTTMSLAEK